MDTLIVDIIIIAGGVIGLFISIVLVTTSFYKSRANNYLSLSLLLLIILTLFGWFNVENNALEFLDNPVFEYLFGITLFTYFLIHLKHSYLKEKWYNYLYLPIISVLILEIVFGLFDLIINDIVFDITDNASLIYNVFFIFWGRRLIKASQTISEAKKRWLLRLNLFIICILAIWLLSSLEIYILNSEYVTIFLWISLSFLSWWVLYYGVFKLQLIVQKDEIHEYLVSNNIKSTLPSKKINVATASKVITQLYVLMNEEELYKNPLLSRLDLANRLETSEGYLSKIINQETNKSITQFVNEYRIETAKNLLHNPVFNKYSIEAIGLEAGFKSKSAFYKTFTTLLEMSPGAYRKLQKKS